MKQSSGTVLLALNDGRTIRECLGLVEKNDDSLILGKSCSLLCFILCLCGLLVKLLLASFAVPCNM